MNSSCDNNLLILLNILVNNWACLPVTHQKKVETDFSLFGLHFVGFNLFMVIVSGLLKHLGGKKKKKKYARTFSQGQVLNSFFQMWIIRISSLVHGWGWIMSSWIFQVLGVVIGTAFNPRACKFGWQNALWNISGICLDVGMQNLSFGKWVGVCNVFLNFPGSWRYRLLSVILLSLNEFHFTLLNFRNFTSG